MTGRHAYAFVEEQIGWLNQAARQLKSKAQDVPERIEQLQNRQKELERENESLTAKLNQAQVAKLLNQVQEVSGVPVLATQVQAGGMEPLRSLMDDLRKHLEEGVIVLGAASADGLPASHPAQAKIRAASGPAAFVCVGETCSLPVTRPDEVAAAVNAMRAA